MNIIKQPQLTFKHQNFQKRFLAGKGLKRKKERTGRV